MKADNKGFIKLHAIQTVWHKFIFNFFKVSPELTPEMESSEFIYLLSILGSFLSVIIIINYYHDL